MLKGFGMAMGFFTMSDLAGNDIGYAVRTSLGLTDASKRDPAIEYSADVADALAQAGRFGQKAGKGWYLYAEPRVPSHDPNIRVYGKQRNISPDGGLGAILLIIVALVLVGIPSTSIEIRLVPPVD